MDGGAEGEVTLRENCRVFEDLTFRPRQAVTVPECELRTRFLGLGFRNPARRRRAHAPAARVRFDRRVGSFVRERSSKLVSRLNAGRKTHLPQQTASPTSEKRIASLQFENASHTDCLPDNSWIIYARQDQAV